MESSEIRQVVDVEPGWQATTALDRMRTPELQAIMRRASFRPIGEWDWVPVAPCLYCRDGGLRVAGTVRVKNSWRVVRVCDTCGAVELSGQQTARSRRA
ncbi:MAG TPA: hypothetical protein VF916_14120 [Ktedonobacterales bacterium]|jgi:hypothetical protein